MNNNKIINILIICFTLIIISYLYSICFTIYEYHDVENTVDNDPLNIKNKINNINLNLNKDKEKFFQLEKDLTLTSEIIKLNSTNIKKTQDQFTEFIKSSGKRAMNNPDLPMNNESENKNIQKTSFEGIL